MNIVEIIVCNVLCIVAVGVATYCIFDSIRLFKNNQIYERTSRDCNGLSCSWAYMKLIESRLELRIDTSSTDEYLEKMNNFRKSVGLPILTKSDLKRKIK